MTIANLCYELYKVDWEDRISTEQKKQKLREYYDEITENDIDPMDYLYEDFLNEYGYDGDYPVCFQEFLSAEFLDNEYMRSLLNDKQYDEYKEYIKEIEDDVINN